MLKFNQFFPTLIEAHPWESLSQHNNWVAQKMLSCARNANEELFLYLVGLFHDAGKYTRFFQYYLFSQGKIEENFELTEKILKYKQHAVFWAFLYLRYVLEFSSFFLKEVSLSELKQYGIAGFYAILKHHSNLENIWTCRDIEWIRKKIAVVKHQLWSIDENIFSKEYSTLLNERWYPEISFSSFHAFINSSSLEKFINEFFFNLSTKGDFSLLYKHVYASLIYADKSKTIFQEREFQKVIHIDKDSITHFKKKKGYDIPTTPLNVFRNAIYDEVSDSLDSLSLEQHFYTLNSPTGSGKTYNLLNIGLSLQDKLDKEGKYSKIVYALPFTSIIDQVFDELVTILESLEISTQGLLVKHHSLADNSLEKEEEDFLFRNYNERNFFIESRSAKIIVTTFFQVFHSFFGEKNRWLMKFPNLRNTIFLLDEIQSTPYRYWENFREMFHILAKEYNCYFVLSSATLPLIFNTTDNPQELLPQYQKYFAQMNRTILDVSLLKIPLSLQDGYAHIKASLNNNKDKHHIITLNTIKSSLAMYNFIKKDFSDEKNILLYLSTNIIPKQRKERIQEIKRLTKNNDWKRIILVSTQMIEAGVDIDLDIWFRDIAPIDSIVQILGRLNRNGLRSEKGLLKVFHLLDEDSKKGSSFWEYIYDVIMRNSTENLLKGKTQITEQHYNELFISYFQLLAKNKSSTVSEQIKASRNMANFHEVHKKFYLIKDDFQSIDLFISLDKEASTIRKKKQQLSFIKDTWKRKEEWGKLKKDFGQYVISVNIKKIQNLSFNEKQIESWLVCLEWDILKEYYDTEIGFIGDRNILLEDNFI